MPQGESARLSTAVTAQTSQKPVADFTNAQPTATTATAGQFSYARRSVSSSAMWSSSSAASSR
jgi:hypothetical protein